MDLNNLCMGCMSEKGMASKCPECGWEESPLLQYHQQLPPRTVLNGKYLIGKVLGCGGFGITYLAWDINLNVKLAIKEYLPRDFAARASDSVTVSPYTGEYTNNFDYGLEKFLDEAKSLAQFKEHPNIVFVRDFFKENGTAYLVMNYIEGMTFKQYIESNGNRIPFSTALNIMMPVLDALRVIHETGMLHRDISPDNIYITKSGQVKLLDFGAARYAVGEHSRSLSVILKIGYAPQEQYHSKGKQGPWTDVYSAGATLYRAVTGVLPSESLDRYEEDTLQYPSAMGVGIPRESEEALMKSLALKPGDRFQTIQEFQQAIVGKIVAEPQTAHIVREHVIYCPHCLHENPVRNGVNVDKLFCEHCGKPLKVIIPEVINTQTLPQVQEPVVIYKTRAGWKIAVAVLAILCVVTGGGWIASYNSYDSIMSRLYSEQTKNTSLNENLKKSNDELEKSKEIVSKISKAMPLIVTDVKLRNETKEREAIGDYTDKFDRYSAQYVSYYITVMSTSGQPVKGKLQVKYIDPDNSVNRGASSPQGYSFEQDISVEEDTAQVNMGWGNSSATAYRTPGTYRIEFWFGGVKIGETSFTVS